MTFDRDYGMINETIILIAMVSVALRSFSATRLCVLSHISLDFLIYFKTLIVHSSNRGRQVKECSLRRACILDEILPGSWIYERYFSIASR